MWLNMNNPRCNRGEWTIIGGKTLKGFNKDSKRSTEICCSNPESGLMKGFSLNHNITLLQSLRVWCFGLTPGCTGGYSHLALSEPLI